ncbi:HEAT repeat domain-containing protein [Marivirga sp.]|uniref:HEAT repeat domain-containing protein n=1 Tax=Marivirga sp. TaxID=2018662 RepID=UPI0025CDCC6F|nr:HEAT repeat domain-containing protein [Marivirga sp.]
MKPLLTITLQFLALSLWAQSSVTALNQYFEEAKNGSYATAPQSLFQPENDFDVLITELEKYQSDSTARIRSKAYNLSSRFAQISADNSVRQKAIDQQINALNDSDRGIAGNAIEAMTNFKNTIFTESHKSRVLGHLNAETPHFNDFVKLIGFLQIKSVIPKLESFLVEKNNAVTRWNIRLSLARMGDEKAIDYITNRLQKAPINDAFSYDIVPGLVYTRQPEIFEFLETQIQSEKANCSVANPDSNQKITCAYRIMEALPHAIHDFPLPTDEFGELMVDDYKKALQDLRKWFNENETYSFNREIY